MRGEHIAARLVAAASVAVSGCWGVPLIDANADAVEQGDGDGDPESDGEPQWSDSERTLILISLDGFRADYRNKAETPYLDRLVAEGVAAEALVPVFPSKTFPNHFTQVTGLYPSEHGIVGNNFWDPELSDSFDMSSTESKWWGGEPIWITAAKQDRKTATVFWPGSETFFDGLRPYHWLPFDGSLPNEARVLQLLTWLAETPRPHFATLYFSDTDYAGHGHGPDSVEVEVAIRRLDASIGQLWRGLELLGLLDEVDIIVVSDHGMTELSRERVIFLDDFLDLEAHRIGAWGTYATITPKFETVAEVLAQLEGLPHASCSGPEDRPPELHYTGNARIPPILCLAEQGWGITGHEYFEANPSNLAGATHGFDPADEDMHGIFYARGPHFKAGYSHPAFESVHLYALMAELLELEPAPNSGRAEATAQMLAD